MKNYKIVLLTTICFVLASCGKWLTIDPEDQIKEMQLYSKAEGFHTQINGIYRAMSGASLYGTELNYGLIEAVAQVYDLGNYSTSKLEEYREAAKYDYEYSLTKSIINNIWKDAYNAITNSNSVISYAQTANPEIFKFGEDERKCILGEAYALRAMLHFDIMRLFAPSLKVNTTGSFVPYQKHFPDRIPAKIPQLEYIANVIADLELAHELTAAMDSSENRAGLINDMDSYLIVDSKGAPAYRFLSYRGYRLNHYAIKALLARVYLYANEQEKALKYAQEIIALQTSKKFFQYNTAYEVYGYYNSKMFNDMIFAGHSNNLSRLYGNVNPDMSTDYLKSDYLSLLDADGIFADEKNKDIRYKNLTKDIGGSRVSTKYLDNSSGSTAKIPAASLKLIPMIRISEMYYIAAECIYSQDKSQAEKYLTFVRDNRGAKNPLATTTTKEQFVQLILNDVRREQLCEGQLFYFYKRLNLPVIKEESEVLILTDEQFSFPIPDSENLL